MEINDPETPKNRDGMPQHWQRLGAKIAQVSNRIARDIRNKLVASGIDPRVLDADENAAEHPAEHRPQKRHFKPRHRHGGEDPPKYRPIR